MALNYFTGSTTGNFGSASNWTLGTVPSNNGDTIIFTSSSPTCSVAAIGTCSIIDFSAYNKTITFTQNINAYGNVTLGPNMKTAGANGITINATASLTSNSYTFSQPLTLNNPVTYTLIDNWNVNALLTCNAINTGQPTASLIINSNNFYCYKNLTFAGGISTLTKGTTIFNMVGNDGTYTWAHTNISLNTIVINMGTVTFSYTGAGNGSNGFGGTLSYLSGGYGAGPLYMSTGAAYPVTLNWNGRTNYLPINIWAGSATNLILSSDVYINSIIGAGLVTLVGTGSVYLYNHSSGTTTAIQGNPNNLYFTNIGNGTTLTATYMNIFFNTANTGFTQSAITLNGTCSVTYLSGIPNNPNLTLNAGSNITLNTFGMTFGATIIGTSNPVVLNSLFNATSLLFGALNGTNTLTYSIVGTSGFSVGALTYQAVVNHVSGTSLTLQAGNTYSITTGLALQSTSTSNLVLSIKSSTPGTSAFLNLAYGASQAVFNVQTTDIDSTRGQTICAFLYSAASTNTKNWLNLQSYRIQNTQIYLN
jgi:hypothetical protein